MVQREESGAVEVLLTEDAAAFTEADLTGAAVAVALVMAVVVVVVAAAEAESEGMGVGVGPRGCCSESTAGGSEEGPTGADKEGLRSSHGRCSRRFWRVMKVGIRNQGSRLCAGSFASKSSN